MQQDKLQKFDWIAALCDDTASFAASNGFLETAKALGRAREAFFAERSIGPKGRDYSERNDHFAAKILSATSLESNDTCNENQSNVIALNMSTVAAKL